MFLNSKITSLTLIVIVLLSGCSPYKKFAKKIRKEKFEGALVYGNQKIADYEAASDLQNGLSNALPFYMGIGQIYKSQGGGPEVICPARISNLQSEAAISLIPQAARRLTMPLRMPRGVPALMLVLTLVLMNGAAQANPVLPVAASAPTAAGDWPMEGQDTARTNYNPAETTISAANVNQLVQRWEYHVGSGASLTSSAPSVANGRVYVGTSVPTGDNFFALDAVSGAFAWSADLGYSNACWHVGIGATPAIAGSLVVAGGGNAP
jgi:hypothetical protein